MLLNKGRHDVSPSSCSCHRYQTQTPMKLTGTCGAYVRREAPNCVVVRGICQVITDHPEAISHVRELLQLKSQQPRVRSHIQTGSRTVSYMNSPSLTTAALLSPKSLPSLPSFIIGAMTEPGPSTSSPGVSGTPCWPFACSSAPRQKTSDHL